MHSMDSPDTGEPMLCERWAMEGEGDMLNVLDEVLHKHSVEATHHRRLAVR